MYYSVLYFLCLLVLLVASLISVIRFREISRSLKLLSLLLITNFLAEGTAFVCGRIFHNNMMVYSLYSPLELFIVCIYFNYSIAIFRQKHIGYWFGALGIVVGGINCIFFQPLNGPNNYFLLFEGILTISLVLFAFARIMIEDAGQKLTHNPHFWVGIAFVFFWVITFCNCGLYEYLYATHPSQTWILGISLVLTNLTFYVGFGLVFFFIPKMGNAL